MNQGFVKIWRKSKKSAVFAHEGLWKLWCLCLMNANHDEVEVVIPGVLAPIKVKPGQFITGRWQLHEDYHQAHIRKRYSRKRRPTPYSLIRWLLTLQYMQMLSIKTCNKYSIITITNWEQYQENVHQVSIKRASSEHEQEVYKKREEETPDFFSLRKRYPDQNLIDQIFKSIASTRKSNRVAESVLVAFLQKCERYPVQQVEAGIRIYLAKDYASQGKNEKYLLGIIRNQKIEEPGQQSTGSALLDSYYANSA